MSNKKTASVMLAREGLNSLHADLVSVEARNLCNQLDRALRIDARTTFLTMSALTPDIVKDPSRDPWLVKECLQAVNLLRFPIWDLDKKEIFSEQRRRVSSLSYKGNRADDLIVRHAGQICEEVLDSAFTSLKTSDLKHGPGVVAETADPLKKREVMFVSRGILHNYSAYLPDTGLVPRDRSARSLLVPKDHKTLRAISAEPTWNQWVQQMVMEALIDSIERHPILRKGICFRDQTRQHALIFKYDVATLDLSDASDTLRVHHLLRLLPNRLDLREKILALRTPTTVFEDEVYPVQALFPMGAATCFPVETLVFATLLVAYSYAEVGKLPSRWGVFGDDIIVDSPLAGGFANFLSRLGFRINRDKSYIVGPFLETCGLYLFRKKDVTPIKIKKGAPSSEQDVRNLTWAAYADEASQRCLTHLASFFTSHILHKDVYRYNRNYQRWEIRRIAPKGNMTNTQYTYPEALLHGSGQVRSDAITASYAWMPTLGGW